MVKSSNSQQYFIKSIRKINKKINPDIKISTKSSKIISFFLRKFLKSLLSLLHKNKTTLTYQLIREAFIATVPSYELLRHGINFAEGRIALIGVPLEQIYPKIFHIWEIHHSKYWKSRSQEEKSKLLMNMSDSWHDLKDDVEIQGIF